MEIVFIIAAVISTCVIVLLLRHWLSALAERRIASYQQDLILKHYEEVQSMYNQVRGWHHDWRTHIQAMKVFLKQGQNEEHEVYLAKLDADLASVDTIIKSGNVMLDAIINSKLSLAVAREIYTNAKATAPEQLTVPEIDLAVIIGNLLDNAIESCSHLPQKARFIRLFIGKHKSMLYISVSNSMGREPKKPRTNRGLGMKRIDSITNKNGGFVNRQYEEGIFATEIMLPM